MRALRILCADVSAMRLCDCFVTGVIMWFVFFFVLLAHARVSYKAANLVKSHKSTKYLVGLFVECGHFFL